MNYYVLILLLIGNLCSAARNPFKFNSMKAPADGHIVGRGMIHDRHVACEAYTTDDGSIKVRLIK